MTLIVAASRSHDHAVMTYDSSAYALSDEDDTIGRPIYGLDLYPKAWALTDYVLVGVGGCIIIGDEFRAMISVRVSPSDDLDACYAAARGVVAELVAIDGERAEQEYAVNGHEATRASIFEHFTVQMCGFRYDGSTAYVQSARGDEFLEFESEHGEFVPAQPYGVNEAEALELRDDHYRVATSRSISGAEGFSSAFFIHRILSRKHPTRVTPDVNVIALAWRTGGPTKLSRTCDVGDLDAFSAVYAEIAAQGGTNE